MNKTMENTYLRGNSSREEPSRLAKLTRGLVTTAAVTAAMLGTVSYIFGFEPQICGFDPVHNHRPDFSSQEYLQCSIEQNGDSLGVRALTYVAYPGAKVGRVVFNLAYAKD